MRGCYRVQAGNALGGRRGVARSSSRKRTGCPTSCDRKAWGQDVQRAALLDRERPPKTTAAQPMAEPPLSSRGQSVLRRRRSRLCHQRRRWLRRNPRWLRRSSSPPWSCRRRWKHRQWNHRRRPSRRCPWCR